MFVLIPFPNSILFPRGGSCLCRASKGSSVSTQAVWRDTLQQPGEQKCKVFRHWSCQWLKLKFDLPSLHVCVYVCSFFSSNWQKWPPSWLHLVFWCVKLRRCCRRTCLRPPLSAPWPNSLSQMSALMWVTLRSNRSIYFFDKKLHLFHLFYISFLT